MNELQLKRLTRIALDHWTTLCPDRVDALKRAGRLDQSLQAMALQTLSEWTSLTHLGQTPEEAWETVSQRYLLLPPESTATPTNDLSDIFQDLAQIHQSLESL